MITALAHDDTRDPRSRSSETGKSPTPEEEPSLLVVDDDPLVRRLLVRYFGGHGWDVTAARELEEAEALLDHCSYDAMITDLGLTELPRNEGLGVLTFARYRHPRMRIVVLTGQGDPRLETETLRMGAHHFVQKPPSLDRLRGLVDPQLEAKS
ncbi:MAG: response regulator [Thermoanaerobaculia bacterium]|nr:response regulator [Thermoanaerobaculia bacterium]